MSEDFWEEIKQEIDGCLLRLRKGARRNNTWESMCAYVKGLMSNVPRKNSWQISKKMGKSSPYSFQYLLYCAKLDRNILQKELSATTIEKLGKNGILTLDEIAFPKRGDLSVGTAMQKSKSRIKNAQVGVFLGYGTEQGHTIIDAALHLPESWVSNLKRCQETGIPEGTVFLNKSEQAIEMLKNFISNGFECSFVTAGEYYIECALYMEKNNQPYMIEIPKDSLISIEGKAKRAFKWKTDKEFEIYELDASLNKGYKRLLFINGEYFYRIFAKQNITIETIIHVHKSFDLMKNSIKMATSQAGLNDYEVRSYQGWNRHIILSLWALGIFTFLKKKILENKRPQS